MIAGAGTAPSRTGGHSASSRTTRPIIPVFLFAAFSLLTLGGCVSTALTAGASVGTAAFDERGVDGVARDTALGAELRAKIIGEDFENKTTATIDIGIEVHERRVLLTGVVDSEEVRASVVQQAWKVDGVETVINEILVGDAGVTDLARDSVITARLRSKITLDRDISAINYAIETVNGIIYLIGVAQSQNELDRVINHARTIPRVRDIITHMRIKHPNPKTS